MARGNAPATAFLGIMGISEVKYGKASSQIQGAGVMTSVPVLMDESLRKRHESLHKRHESVIYCWPP